MRGTKPVASVQSHRGPFLYDIIIGAAIAPVSRFGARVRLFDETDNLRTASLNALQLSRLRRTM